MIDVGVLRIRKGRPGVGRRIAALFGGEEHELTCGFRPAHKVEQGALIINYGRGDRPIWWRGDMRVLNHWTCVADSANKVSAFDMMKANGVQTMPWTINKKFAEGWLNAGKRVFVRKTVNGKKGQGIVIVEGHNTPLPDAPLYTLAYEKKHEFRVFVAGGKVIDLVQKRKMSPEKFEKAGRFDEIDMDLRNYRRGWVFAHETQLGPKGTKYIHKLALDAMAAVGLDYGAVDILYKSATDMVVCETNSAPAMRGKTTWGAFKKYFEAEYENN